MTTPSIQFRDSIGAVTITAQGPTLNNWTPDVDEINDRQVPVGTGIESFWRYRRDFWAAFEMANIPAANLADLHRLKSHLLTGGFITVNTNDAASRVYTCSVKPGATPSWSFSDRTMLEYTLSLEVRNVMPYPMLCDYKSGMGGTTGNLIVNGGGETGADGATATGWTDASGSALKISVGDTALAGNAVLRYANTSLLTLQTATQSAVLTAGKRYQYSAWGRVTGAAADRAQLSVFDSTAGASVTFATSYNKLDSTRLAVVATSTVTTDWKFMACLFDAANTGSHDFNVVGVSAGTSEIWFDQVRAEEVPKV